MSLAEGDHFRREASRTGEQYPVWFASLFSAIKHLCYDKRTFGSECFLTWLIFVSLNVKQAKIGWNDGSM